MKSLIVAIPVLVFMGLNGCHQTVNKERIAEFRTAHASWKMESEKFKSMFLECESGYQAWVSLLEDTTSGPAVSQVIMNDSAGNLEFSGLKVLHLNWVSAGKVLAENYQQHLVTTNSWMESLTKDGVSEETAMRQWEERKVVMSGIRERTNIAMTLCDTLSGLQLHMSSKWNSASGKQQ